MKKIFVDMMPLFEKESTRKGSNWLMIEIYAEDRMDDNHVDAIRAVVKKGLRELHEYGQATSIAADAPKRKESTSSSKDDVPTLQRDAFGLHTRTPPWYFTDREKISWLVSEIHGAISRADLSRHLQQNPGGLDLTQVRDALPLAVARGDWVTTAAIASVLADIEGRYKVQAHWCVAE